MKCGEEGQSVRSQWKFYFSHQLPTQSQKQILELPGPPVTGLEQTLWLP